MSVPHDPLDQGGISEFGRRLRARETTCAQVTEVYLERIGALEPALGAFEFVAENSARTTASALDELLAAGTDLGPLMGVPVAIKDIVAVDGMPATADPSSTFRI